MTKPMNVHACMFNNTKNLQLLKKNCNNNSSKIIKNNTNFLKESRIAADTSPKMQILDKKLETFVEVLKFMKFGRL